MRDRMKRQSLSKRPSTAHPSSRRPHDEIDAIVQSHLAQANEIGRLVRLSRGVYSVNGGSRKYTVCIKNGKPLVQIGGGAYVTLSVFLINPH